MVIGAALLTLYFAENLSNQTGLNKSFTGTVLLAASTSLPEVAVSVEAIRMEAINMAVGNLFNIFWQLFLQKRKCFS